MLYEITLPKYPNSDEISRAYLMRQQEGKKEKCTSSFSLLFSSSCFGANGRSAAGPHENEREWGGILHVCRRIGHILRILVLILGSPLRLLVYICHHLQSFLRCCKEL